MGRFHCIDSSCAIVWFKIPGKETEYVGDYVKFSYQTLYSGWEQADPHYLFEYVKASGFSFTDNHPNRCYFGADEVTRNNIISAKENNPEDNYMPSTMVWDSIPTGTWTGHRGELAPFEPRFTAGDRGIVRVGHFTGAAIDGDYDATEHNGGMQNGKPVIYWQGEVDYLFLSMYTADDGVYRYDINVIEKDTCHISQVAVGRDYNEDAPRVFQVERHDAGYTSTLTFHNYQGAIYGSSDRGSQITSDQRPTYLELINPRPKGENLTGDFTVRYASINDLATDGLRYSKQFFGSYYVLEYDGEYYNSDDVPFNPDGTLSFVNSEPYFLRIYSGNDGSLIDTISSPAYRIGSEWDSYLGQPNYFWVDLLPQIIWHRKDPPQTPERTPDRWVHYKVEKTPYLDRLEVVPFAYEMFGFNLYQKDIPDDCMNIYVNDVTGAVTISGVPYPANPFYNSWEFIAQFCSDDGKSPPEYYVVCDCQEECPDNTCSIECGDHICCYDRNGIAVMSVPKLQLPT